MAAKKRTPHALQITAQQATYKLLATLLLGTPEECSSALEAAYRAGIRPDVFSDTAAVGFIFSAASSGICGESLRDAALQQDIQLSGILATAETEDYRYRTATTVNRWCQEIIAGHVANKVAGYAALIEANAHDSLAARTLVTDLQAMLDGTAGSHAIDLVGIDQARQDLDSELAAYAEQKKRGNLLETGLDGLDSLLGPLGPGDTTVVAARTSVGKSKLAHNFVSSAATHGHSAAVFSLEMRRQQVALRLWSIQTGNATNQYRKGVGTLQNVYICDTPSLSAVDIVTRIRYAPVRPKLVVVDYLGIMQHPMLTNTTEAWSIGQSLKTMRAGSRELGYHLIAVCQINRAGAEHEEPDLHHLRGSGDIEQDAEHIILLYNRKNDLIAKVAKNRLTGQTGKVALTTYGDSCRLIEL